MALVVEICRLTMVSLMAGSVSPEKKHLILFVYLLLLSWNNASKLRVTLKGLGIIDVKIRHLEHS